MDIKKIYKKNKLFSFCNDYNIKKTELLEDNHNYFRYVCYNYLDFIKYIELPYIKKKNIYESVLIEFRKLPHIEFIIRNNILKLGTDWCHTVICGNLNYEMVNNICSNITVNSVGKSLGDTINISCISEITQYGLPLLLNLIPGYLGVVVLVENIPLIGSYAESIIDNFYWTIGFIISYMSINMTNYSNSTDYCAKTFFGTKWNMFFVLVSILILVSIHAYTFIKNNVFDIILGFF